MFECSSFAECGVSALTVWLTLEIVSVVAFLISAWALTKIVGIKGIGWRLRHAVTRLVPERVVYRDCDCGCDPDEDYDNEDYDDEDED